MKNHSKKQLKVAVVGYKLADGGLERVFANVSNLLHEAGIEVHTIILETKVEYDFSGKLLVLGNYSKVTKYFKFKSYLKKNKIHHIIDFRYRLNPLMELFFLHYIYKNTIPIYTVHSNQIAEYFTHNNWIANQMFKNKIVAVSDGVKNKIEKIYSIKNIQVIYNAIQEKHLVISEKLSFDYILAVGRLVPLKQFDQLILSYSKSKLPERNIHLVIMGDGEDFQKLEAVISALELEEFVHLIGFKKNIDNFMINAKFLVVTSLYEGFPMAILESLSLGTPVISFDCESGPNEMIQNYDNGILVENQNFTELTHKMNIFVEDELLYQKCKNNAVLSVAKFHSSQIINQWLQILNYGN